MAPRRTSLMPSGLPVRRCPVSIWRQPRRRGDREALRVLLATRKEVVQTRTRAINHLKALVINAPEAMRAELRSFKTGALVVHCATLQTCTAPSSAERAATVLTLQLTARRIQSLEAEAAELEAQIEPLVQALAPRLRAEFGVGPISAAQIICAWSHAGRLRSEAVAALAGVAPIPASSGQVQRHRLNRSGDRHLNCALHTIVICRLARHAETQAYAARRATEGKTSREITRCLKRHRPP